MLTNEKLGKAIEAAIKKKGVKPADVARHFQIKPPSVQGWMRTGRIRKDNLMMLMDYFSDVVGPEHWGLPAAPSEPLINSEGVVSIPRFNIDGSMGGGLVVDQSHVEVIERMMVSVEYLRRTLSFSSLQNLAIITGYGDSMEGTFSDGDLLLVDRGVNAIKLDAVYVLGLGNELYIKRIQRRPSGTFLMLSDNIKYPPYEIQNGEADQFQVLARVLLVWNAKRL